LVFVVFVGFFVGFVQGEKGRRRGEINLIYFIIVILIN